MEPKENITPFDILYGKIDLSSKTQQFDYQNEKKLIDKSIPEDINPKQNPIKKDQKKRNRCFTCIKKQDYWDLNVSVLILFVVIVDLLNTTCVHLITRVTVEKF